MLSKPLNELIPYPGARLMAGFQMGFIGVVLLPVLKPPVTYIAAVIFMVPFLLGFLRDWWVICAKIQTDHRQPAGWEKKLHGLFTVWVPLCLRFLIIVAAVALACKLISDDPELNGLLRQHFHYWPGLKMSIIFIILSILLGLGILGRLVALFLGLLAGYLIVSGVQAIEYYLIFICACCLLLTGAGLFSVWQPEDKIIMGNRYKDTELLKLGQSNRLG